MDKLLNSCSFEVWFEEYYDSDNFLDYIGLIEDDYDDYMSQVAKEDYAQEKKKFLKENAMKFYQDRLEQWTEQLAHSEYNDTGIFVCRAMGIEDVETFIEDLKKKQYHPGYEGIGNCFSFEKDKAEAHSYVSGEIVYLDCFVFWNSIDYSLTGLLNLSPSLGEMEAEIRTKYNSKVILNKIYNRKGDILLNENIELSTGT